MRGGNPNSTENNSGKQCMSVHTPAKRLLGTGPQTPEKSLHWRPFSTPLTGRLRVLTDAVNILLSSRSSLSYSAPARARSRSTCEAFGKAAQAALVGGLGAAPNKLIFGEKRKCICTCPACHYSKTAKEEVRLLPIRRTKTTLQTGIVTNVYSLNI